MLTNMVLGAEQHINWIADAIVHLHTQALSSVEATAEAANEWTAHLDDMASKTLAGATRSWYSGANIEGKPQVVMPYLGGFAVS